MKSLLIGLLFMLLSIGLQAQLGVSVKYQNNNSKNWNDIYQLESGTDNSFLSSSIEYGLNYWLRLKNQRIEFLPELTYGKMDATSFDASQDIYQAELTRIGLNVNVQIYPLDFFNDCNCPTFSKDGNFVTKGFYWLVAPGVTSNAKKISYTVIESGGEARKTASSDSNITPHIGVGMGLDIGVADIFTISPFLMYNLSFGHDWPELYNVYPVRPDETADTSSNISAFNVGLRLIFRPDYVKEKRGRGF